ncbi:hypothetical protein F442_21680 [Plasmopara halstedii]|uniref:Uncharacterized protein n=1 Tax=Plasmopara halstedii TaxID=4781 RepID=A0A0P1ANS1_PLAHL|nr:hypothetical protein F442_21680 [Plasmopara halstedii]CEG42912.1 hypothetical protein F442_21680 [Plasmopara halstedii]|eukprot:XP_024579281.1 hypothetical protein F442_21680 [Plasmopara halstedii]
MRRSRRQRLNRDKVLADSSDDPDVLLILSSEEARSPAQKVKAFEKESSWKCSMCTFINVDVTNSQCKLCESYRSSSPRKVQKLSQWLSLPGNKKAIEITTNEQPSDSRFKRVEGANRNTSGENNDVVEFTSVPLRDGRAAHFRCNDIGVNKIAAQTQKGLWADLYTPKTVEDLCVNRKKVHEIAKWLECNASPIPGRLQKRLLFLCGPPGSGKSTAVRCIARQLGLQIKEWKDNSAAGSLDYKRKFREDSWIPHTSSLDDFSDFIYRSTAFTALPVATSRHASTIRHERRSSCSQQGELPGSTRHIVIVETWPQSWSNENSLCDEKLRKIYQAITDPTRICHYPVVCIYSDVREGKIDLDHLSRIFSTAVINSPQTTIIHVNAVTSPQLKKHLKYVAAQEKCRFHSADFDSIIGKCNGDMRHALNMLQLLQPANVTKHESMPTSPIKSVKKLSVNSKSSSVIRSGARDLFLSEFHVIGKLLYGKTIENNFEEPTLLNSDANDRGYDQIFDASTMTLDRILGLVHENSIAFFSQIDGLSDAMELMSLCESIIAESYKCVSSSVVSIRSHDVARAILTRTVAITNEIPAPKAFRSITRPRAFLAKQRIVSRREEMFVTTRGVNGLDYACTGDIFVFEVEPFLTIMDREGRSLTQQHPGRAELSINDLSPQEVYDDIEISDSEW